LGCSLSSNSSRLARRHCWGYTEWD
jgi:hypothetical protein